MNQVDFLSTHWKNIWVNCKVVLMCMQTSTNDSFKCSDHIMSTCKNSIKNPYYLTEDNGTLEADMFARSTLECRLSFVFCVFCSFCTGQVLCTVNIHETGTTRHRQLTQSSGFYYFLTTWAFSFTTGAFSHRSPRQPPQTPPLPERPQSTESKWATLPQESASEMATQTRQD